MKASLRSLAILAVATPVFVACADEPTVPAVDAGPAYSAAHAADAAAMMSLVSEVQPLVAAAGDGAAFLGAINARMAGEGVAALRADLLLAATATDPNFATVVYANDRTHQTGFRFVANDPRRAGAGTAVRQVTFTPLSFAPTGAGSIPSQPAINASFATWNAVPCANVRTEPGILPGNVFPSSLLGLPGFVNNSLLNDINTVGFIPGSIFDLVFGPGASGSVLAVTIPFTFIDAAGNPTDIDRDGNADLAFAEIWYNASFPWNTTGTGSSIDIETVALHENGHALGLGHFGRIAVNTSAGKLQVSPRAVMNAIVLGTLRTPLGTDNAAYCQTWASWPK